MPVPFGFMRSRTRPKSPQGIAGGGSDAFTNIRCKGKYKSYDWVDIQPSSAGSYTWTAIDNQITNSGSKDVIVLMNLTSGNPSGGIGALPPWLVYDAVTNPTGAVAYNAYNPNHMDYFYQFLPWDPAFIAAASVFIAAMGAKYDGVLASVTMGGLGGNTEWHLASPSPDGLSDNDAVTAWIPAAKAIISAYGKAFKQTAFVGAIAPPISSATNANAALQEVVDFAINQFGAHFGMENWGLNALSNNGYLPNKLIQDHSKTNPVGFQMAGSVAGGGAPLHGTLRQAMDAGVALGAQYLQVYGTDTADAANAADLDAINTNLAARPLTT